MDTQSMIHRVSQALLGMQRHAWEQGTAAQAFLELGEADLVVAMARDAVIRQLADGRLGMIGTPECSTDPGANGEAVLFAARVSGDAALEAAAQRQLDWLLHRAPRSAQGVLYHHTHTRQMWVDSLYMAPPFIAVAGHPHEAIAQIDGFRDVLWDPQKRLFHHIWDDDTRSFARAAFWGVGNGWAAAGMTRVLAALPQEMTAERDRLVGYVGEVIEGCLAHLRPDGLFHDFVDDPSTFVETNLAQMISYSIYRGVAAGWLERAFLEPALRMRSAAHAKVDRFGFVQGVCGSPHFDHSGVAPEGQAFFLLMEAAARRFP
jgi:unsaturated rhamnogalacturonyl hydrolase